MYACSTGMMADVWAWVCAIVMRQRVSHATMMSYTIYRTVVNIPGASAIIAPAMTTAVGCPYCGTLEIEEGANGIVGINTEVPHACIPIKRTVEIRRCTEGIPLPVIEDNLHVEIALAPVFRIEVVNGVYTHEVVKIDFVGCLILLLREVELVSHLVGEEQGLLASLLIAHGFYACNRKEQCYHCDYKLLHNSYFFLSLAL